MRRVVIILFIFHSSILGFGQDTTRLRMLFVGDVMQHDSQIRAALADAGAYDYLPSFQYVKPVISQADVAFANLEVTLAGPPYKGYPQFSAPDQLAAGLKDAGFDVLVTANNHSLDRRRKGLERTIDVLDSLQVLHAGTYKDSTSREMSYPLLIESNGFTLSLLNYTYGTNGIPVTPPNIVNLIDTLQIKSDLLTAKEQRSDVIIVFMHWGAEYKDMPGKSQKELAEFCFRNGASLIVGAHPHVLQPMYWEKDRGKMVAYSLGNFVSGQQSRYRDGGAMLHVELRKVKIDSVSNTRIDSVSYELVWVYRKDESPKKYFILPVKEFVSDSIIMHSQIARDNFNLFVSDSRKLLSNNKEVKKTERTPLELQYYRLLLATTPKQDSIASDSIIDFFGLHGEANGEDQIDWMAGKFYDRELAEKALDEIIKQTAFKDAELKSYYWDRRID